jgi:hypothetical protein
MDMKSRWPHWRASLLTLLVMLAGCATKTQVLYSGDQRSTPQLSFFMDRAGDLYPPASVPVDDSEMLATRSAGDFATLRATYREKAKESKSHDWPALLSATGVTSGGSFEQDWEHIQAALQTDLAGRITREASDADGIVLLIHGFNNTYAEATEWYEFVEADLSRYAASKGQDLAFVRMYWNGLTGSPPSIWTAAQANGPWVGLGLRRVFNRLPTHIPLRVFTHSSGAFVMTNALGDGSSAFPDMGEPYFTRVQGGDGHPIPTLSNIRLAMLVPAQPLTAYGEFIREDGVFGLTPNRVVLGTSRRDFATGKARFFTPCWLYGATCMTVKPRKACELVWGDLQKKPILVDFTQPLLRSHPHEVNAYRKDPEWAELIAALLDDHAPTTAAQGLCRSPIESEHRRRN